MTDVHFRQWTIEDADGRMVDVIPVDDHEELVARLHRQAVTLDGLVAALQLALIEVAALAGDRVGEDATFAETVPRAISAVAALKRGFDAQAETIAWLEAQTEVAG